MRWFRWGLALLMAGYCCTGCNKGPAPAAAAPPPAPVADGYPTKPQPKLPTIKLWLGTQEVVAEICRSEEQVRTGMMWRTNLAEMEGMVFVFPRPESRSFWMRNCPRPLTCAYIDPDGIILETHDMKPFDLTPIDSKSDQIQFVLEVNQGWFERNKVSVGMQVRTEFGTLKKIFFDR